MPKNMQNLTQTNTKVWVRFENLDLTRVENSNLNQPNSQGRVGSVRVEPDPMCSLFMTILVGRNLT